MPLKIACVLLVLLQVTGTFAVIWTTVPGYPVINPDGSPLSDCELQVAVTTIVPVRHEFCFDHIRPGHPKFRVFNNKTNCSTLYEDIVDDQVVMFDESCVTLKPRRDHQRACFTQNKPGAELMKIGNRIWMICGPDDLIETANWRGICSRRVIPYDSVLKINNKPTMHSKGQIRIHPTTPTRQISTTSQPTTTPRPATVPIRTTSTTPQPMIITSQTTRLPTTTRLVTTPGTSTTPRPTAVVQTTTICPTTTTMKTPTTKQPIVITTKPSANNILIRDIDNIWKQEKLDFKMPTFDPTPTMTTPTPQVFDENEDWNRDTPTNEKDSQSFIIWTLLWIVAAGIVIKCFSECVWWFIKEQLDKLRPHIEMCLIRFITRSRPLIEEDVV